jgi:beta-galactosidase
MIETPLRQRHDLSCDWEFVRGRVGRGWLAGRGEAGEQVDLPHCWNRGDTFQYGRHSYSGWGAYRRVVDVPAPVADGGWRLRSGGFYGIGDIWLDGARLTQIDAQYLGFSVDLPPRLNPGRHLLAVRLDNRWRKNVLPGAPEPDFLLYGGLAGRVWLERLPAIRIDTDRVEIACTRGRDGAEDVELRCAIADRAAGHSLNTLSWIVSDADGSEIAAVGPISAGGGTVVVTITIPAPRCWSPEDPNLYWAEGRLESDTGVADVVRVRFGITRAEFRPDQGFFLDGRRVDLHGCNRHESIPGLGNALPEELHRSDARLLKDYGCNFVRLSHYPQHPAFLDACDELGILVYAEIASWKSVRSARGWRRAARRQIRDLIVRDRHHPSVILWGMGNESRSRPAYLELREIANTLDPARPVTYAENHLYRARRERTVGISDVWGVNYELDVLEDARDASRLRNVILSECCNHPTSVKGDDREELLQVAVLEREWALMAERPYLAGYAVWGLSDYATEHRERYRRLNGLFDAWRRPKMAAELFRARYAAAAFVSPFVTGAAGDGQTLHAFTNCERLRVLRDDATPIVLDKALHHAVDLGGGFTELTVEGLRGEVVVRRRLRACGEAATVAITIDKGEAKPGRTVAVDLAVVDGAGTPVHDWNGHVHVAAEGDAHLFAYTDAGEVLMARGEGRAYLELGGSGSEIVITTHADGLEPGNARFRPASS